MLQVRPLLLHALCAQPPLRTTGSSAPRAFSAAHTPGYVCCTVAHTLAAPKICLGRGSYGTVYKALDTDSGHPVALKCIPIEEGDASIAAIEEEIHLLQGCDHPNIVNYLVQAFDPFKHCNVAHPPQKGS